jgi:biotin synthase-related radical SAM superfamily protein
MATRKYTAAEYRQKAAEEQRIIDRHAAAKQQYDKLAKKAEAEERSARAMKFAEAFASALKAAGTGAELSAELGREAAAAYIATRDVAPSARTEN